MNGKLLLTGLLVAASATPALAAKDDFNRATLGAKWVTTAGSLYIVANTLQGDPLSLGYFTKAASSNSGVVTVTLNGTDTQYGAVALGNIGAASNAFVKLQTQDGSGTFSHGAFYVGNNGGGSFFTLAAPAASPAKLSVSMTGTVATMTINSSLGTQTYTFDYGTSYGPGAGLGTYGTVSLDNFKSKAVLEAAAKPIVIRGSNAVDMAR